MRKILRLTQARCLEFLRDKEALAWNLLMPIFFVVAIALAFSAGEKNLFKIMVVSQQNTTSLHDTAAVVPQLKYVKYIPIDNLKIAQEYLAQHQVDLVVQINPLAEYWFNPLSEKSDFLHQTFEKLSSHSLKAHSIESANIRYIDWVFPGILAVHLMYSALYGIAYVIVRYRKNGYLKRLQATPLTAFEFLSAQICSRLLISSIILALVYFTCAMILHPIMKGSLFLLFILYITGTFCLISLALLLCARITSEELSRGILEMAAWPMLLISGAWFSLDQAHISLQWLSQILPLTHLISATRQVMLYGASLQDIQGELLILLGMSIGFLLIGSLTFKWSK